jgi:hypothetical protein
VRSEHAREKMLSMAEHLFAAAGFDGDSMRQVGAEVDRTGQSSSDGWKKTTDLAFAGTMLGLRCAAWAKGNNPEIDLITSDEPWLLESFAAPRVRKC